MGSQWLKCRTCARRESSDGGMKEARIGNDGTARPPLEGIRVLELAEIWAAPFCAALRGELGAEVIKGESIQRIARGPIRPGATASGYADGDPGERVVRPQGGERGAGRGARATA